MFRREFLTRSTSAAALPFLVAPSFRDPTLFETMLADYVDAWRRSSAYLLRVAAAMPEEDYDFRPSRDVRSFAEQILHLSTTTFGFASIVEGTESPSASRFDRYDKSKAEMITQLRAACDYGAAVLADLSEDRALKRVPWGGVGYEDITELPVLAVVNVLRLHTAHHWAQLTLHLRLRGIVPPPYVD